MIGVLTEGYMGDSCADSGEHFPLTLMKEYSGNSVECRLKTMWEEQAVPTSGILHQR